MKPEAKDDVRALYARMEDLCRRADMGEVGESEFLSPRLCHYGETYVQRKGVRYAVFGGYEDAERKKIYVLPEYMTDEGETDLESRLTAFGYSVGVTAIRIDGSGYRTLTHRDFLGSLLGLGLERSVLGDLVTLDESGRSAVVFCEEGIAPFLLRECTKVANDKVKVTECRLSEVALPPRRFTPIHDTVASPRLDSVVAALCNLSREKARELVCREMVEMNFESEERPDRTVTPPALISVRGFGRYRVLKLGDLTRKGRLRIEAEQYR